MFGESVSRTLSIVGYFLGSKMETTNSRKHKDNANQKQHKRVGAKNLALMSPGPVTLRRFFSSSKDF
jgi:hypothetical protein